MSAATWANPSVDPDKPMTTYTVSITCDAQLTEAQLIELVHHWLESPGIGEAGFAVRAASSTMDGLTFAHSLVLGWDTCPVCHHDYPDHFEECPA